MKRTRIIILVAGTLLLVFLASAAYRKATVLVDEPARRTRIVNRVSLLEIVRDQLNNSVIAVRGYLLTGEETYLKPYQEAIPVIQHNLAAIRTEYIRNPALYERLSRLEARVADRFQVLGQSIELRRKGEYTPRIRRSYTAKAASLDREINALIDRWVTEDITLSEQLGMKLSAALRNLIATALWGTGLSILLLSMLFALNRARNRALLEKQKALQDAKASAELAITEKFFMHMLDTLPGPVMYVNSELVCEHCNDACGRALGLSANAMVGRSVRDIMSANPLLVDGFEKARTTGLFSKQVIAFHPPAEPETEIFYDVSFTVDKDDSNAIAGVIASGTDVTELVKMQHELDKRVEDRTRELSESLARLAESEANLRTILEGVYDGIFIHDENGKILDVNKKMLEMYGLTYAQAIGSSIVNDLSAPGSPLGELERIWNRVMSGEAVLMEWKARRPADGAIFPVEVFLRRITLRSRSAILASVRDITERKKMEEMIRHQAHHDALTDLPNRLLFSDLLALELSQAKRNRKKMALLFFDLDRFKEINDTLGHEVGDRLLKEVARRLRETIRASDTVARIGGDEFNILLADISRPEDIGDIADKLVSRFRSPFFISGRNLYVTTSIGISIYPDDSTEIEGLLRYADMAMYHAKGRGRNTYEFYDPAINSRSIERIRLEGMLRSSIERRELVMHYQPQVNIRSNEMICVEALVRWQHPERGLLLPHEFLPLADETGFITEIDDWALKTVCEQMRSWSNSGTAHFCITVNLSSRQFHLPDLAARIGAVLNETGVSPECLAIEVSESTVMSNIDMSAGQMRRLRGMGVHISIDDFGTGYSSLNYLKRLPIEHLKIDKTFVKDIAADADDRAIIHAVTSMARHLGIRTVAEGVETEEQLSFLRSAECDEAQGYLFGRPARAEEFEGRRLSVF